MCANEKIIEPKVDSAQEFIEIAMDFSNPLDLVREAVSNAFDAQAREIVLDFSVIQEYGEKVLKIKIGDNGTGKNIYPPAIKENFCSMSFFTYSTFIISAE